jgi:hypothetical protein
MVATAMIVLKKLEKGDLDQKFVWQLKVKVFQKHSKVFLNDQQQKSSNQANRKHKNNQ